MRARALPAARPNAPLTRRARGVRANSDELSALHHELLQQASTALEESSDAVNWLKEERQQAASEAARAMGLRTATDPALGVGGFPVDPPRRQCCPCGASCGCAGARCTIQ